MMEEEMSKQEHRFEYRGETVEIWQAPDGRWSWGIDESRIFDGAPISRESGAIFKTPERATGAVMGIIDGEIDGD
jgi:hypothetical protein